MAAYFCPHCKVYATFANHGPDLSDGTAAHSIWTCSNCSRPVWGSARRILYPQVRSDAPEECPEAVRRPFGEALRSLNVNNPNSAVIMARTALQAATRDQGGKGNNLKQEIDSLAHNHVIPDALRKWAHELRDGGNLVAHPEPGKSVEMADAEELIELADSLFDYLYVIPAQFERRRERLAEKLKPEQEETESE